MSMKTEGDTRLNHEGTPAWMRFKPLVVFDTGVRHLEDWLNIASVLIITFLMFFASAEIVGRYLFNSPIHGHVEIVELLMAGIIFFGASYTERTHGHVRMELFITKVLGGRSFHIAEVITTAAALFVFIFILIFTAKSAFNAYQIGDTTPNIYAPTWPSKFAIPLGCAVLCVRFIIEIIQHLSQAIAGGEYRDITKEK
jgi:C4-dicarboxylate transporter DctQ subunit